MLMGGFWGVAMAVFATAYTLHLRPEGGAELVGKAICIALSAAVGFGLVMAAIIRSRARKASLPAWDDLGILER